MTPSGGTQPLSAADQAALDNYRLPGDSAFSADDQAKLTGLVGDSAQAFIRLIKSLEIFRTSTDTGQRRAAQDYIQNNPAAMNALDIGGGGGKADGKFSKGDVTGLLNHLVSDCEQAIKDAPAVQQGDDASRSAALLLISTPLLQVADPSHNNGAKNQTSGGGSFGASDLQALLNGNPDLAPLLKGTAGFFTQPGVPLNGPLSSGDIDAWLKQTAFDKAKGTITLAPSGSAPPPSADDLAVLDKSSKDSGDAQGWAGLASSPDQQTMLNRQIEAVKLLCNSTDARQQQAALNYINGDPALANLLDVGGGTGKADGKVGKADAQNALKKLTDARDQAKKSMPAMQPGAGAAAEITRDAALLAANAPLLKAADPARDPGAKNQSAVGEVFGATDLNAVADGNPGLASDLKNAAAMFAQPGMLHQIDNAGTPATQSDGWVSSDDLNAWLKAAPRTDADATKVLLAAADWQTTSGVDRSTLDSDILANPQNHSARDRAAALEQLESMKAQFDAGNQAGLYTAGVSGDILPQDVSHVDDQLSQDITELTQFGQPSGANGQDTSATTYIAQQEAGALQAIVNKDPSLRNDVTGSGYASLHNSLSETDSNGKPVTQPQALADFEREHALQGELLTGKPVAATSDVSAVLASNPDDAASIRAYYQTHIVNASDLSGALDAKGATTATAMDAFTQETAIYDAAVGGDMVQQTASDRAQNADDAFTAHQENSLSNYDPTGLAQLFGVDTGNQSDDTVSQNLANYIMQHQAQLAPADQGQTGQVNVKDVASIIKSIAGEVKSGVQLNVALGKLSKDPSSLSGAYSAGSFHAVAAFFAAGAALVSAGYAANGGGKEATGYVIGGALSAAGLQSSAMLKDLASQAKASKAPAPDVLGKWFKNLEEVYKTAEGAGNALSAAGSAVCAAFAFIGGLDAIHAGDVPAAVSNLTTAAGGTLSAAASTVQAAGAALRPLGSIGAVIGSEIADGVASVAVGVLSSIGGGLALIGTVAPLIPQMISDIKQTGKQEAFSKSMFPQFDQYGIDYSDKNTPQSGDQSPPP